MAFGGDVGKSQGWALPGWSLKVVLIAIAAYALLTDRPGTFDDVATFSSQQRPKTVHALQPLMPAEDESLSSTGTNARAGDARSAIAAKRSERETAAIKSPLMPPVGVISSQETPPPQTARSRPEVPQQSAKWNSWIGDLFQFGIAGLFIWWRFRKSLTGLNAFMTEMFALLSKLLTAAPRQGAPANPRPAPPLPAARTYDASLRRPTVSRPSLWNRAAAPRRGVVSAR